ncbi:hypothetical protein pdam_00021129, partial [Pocillopora damicornis]
RCRGCRKRRNVRSNSFFEEFPRVPLGKLLQKVHFFSAEDSQRRISRLLDLNASLISKISRHLQDGCPRDSGQANHALWWTYCGKMHTTEEDVHKGTHGFLGLLGHNIHLHKATSR